MLCTCYRDGQWAWLSAHETPGANGLVLLERRGGCPGDPDGTVARLIGLAGPDRLISEAAAWLGRGWATAGDRDRPARIAAVPAAAPPVAIDPSDRRLDPAAARAVVEASVTGAERPFCLFPNSAVHGR